MNNCVSVILLVFGLSVTAAEAQTARSLRRGPVRKPTGRELRYGNKPNGQVSGTVFPVVKTVVFVGSSVCGGADATRGNGWCQQFGRSLGDRGWNVFIRAVDGDTTQGVINRFASDVASLEPDVVVVCLSLNNEGLASRSDDQNIYNNFMDNMSLITNMISRIGAAPVIAGTYPNDGYDAVDATYLQASWNEYDHRGIPWIDFSSLDNRNGHWPAGISPDGTHPDDRGHAAMFFCASPSLLDNIADWDSRLIVPSAGAVNTGSDNSTDRPISVAPVEPMASFTLFFRVKNRNGVTGRSFCGVGANISQICISNSLYTYTTSTGVDVKSNVDGTARPASWHSLCLAHESITNTTRFYVDGNAIGDATETLDPTLFSFGGRSDAGGASFNAQNVDLKDILIYRSRLLDQQVQRLDAGNYSIGSLEVFAPCNDARPGPFLANLAPTETTVVVNSNTVVAETSDGPDRRPRPPASPRLQGSR